ncbi:MAG: HAMP domain-containing histidine kinase [Acidimicrobiia bacterium]|nr:HAMP domain-containing histidine kinase [Acidimicrobiia bacterium]
MRRRLMLVFVATSTMVALAFVVPLAALVQRTVADRAVDTARAEAASVVPSLVLGDGAAEIEAAVGQTQAGLDGRMTVVLADGSVIGAPLAGPSDRVDQALANGRSSTGETDGGIEVVTAVAGGGGQLSAIRVFVPRSLLWDGVFRAWALLASVGAALVAISVLVADRLARSVVQPVQRLAGAAQELGQGRLDVTVEPSGPEELVELAGAFNDLGGQVSSMLAREREMVADLSHRLRTPLTKLRLRVDQVGDPDLVAELRSDVDDLTGVVTGVIREARGALRRDARCDAGKVVAERAEFWRALADDQGRPMHTSYTAEPLPVAVNAVELAAVVDNLVDNVFSHTSAGTEVIIGCERAGSSVRIRVGDHGPGFPDEFDLAERGRSGGGSTGLGLDIARQLAAEANGELTLGSTAAGGALVTLTLPLVTG